MRFTALFPLACAITAFVLALFCLLAGSTPGYMEEYHIVALNTSTLGHNLLDLTKTSSPPSSASPTSVGSYLTGIVENVTSTIENEINDIQNDLVDKLAAEIGIKQWYSLHMMDMCEGTYSPNATAVGASYNVSKCTNKTAMYHFDPAGTIQEELQVGKLQLNLTSIQWPDELTDGLAAINALLDATFVLFCIGIAACGLVIIFSAIAFFLPSTYAPSPINHHYHSRMISLLGGAMSLIAFLALGLASAIVTAFVVKATSVANEYGNQIGLYAYKGDKFLALTWASTGVMFFAILAWVVGACLRRKATRREWAEKPTGGRGWRERM